MHCVVHVGQNSLKTKNPHVAAGIRSPALAGSVPTAVRSRIVQLRNAGSGSAVDPFTLNLIELCLPRHTAL